MGISEEAKNLKDRQKQLKAEGKVEQKRKKKQRN